MRLQVEGNTWLSITTKMHNKPWLQKLPLRTRPIYADYLLGEKVYTLTIPGYDDRPSMAGHLALRATDSKKTFRVFGESGTQIDVALVSARHALDSEIHFASSLALLGFGENSLQILLTEQARSCLLYTSPSPRDRTRSRMPSSA